MPSKREKVTVRLFAFGWKEWNHKWRTILLLPLFTVIGQLIGVLGGVHLFPAAVPDALVIALFAGASILIGSALLALID